MTQPLHSMLIWLLLIVAGLIGVTMLAWLSGADPLAVGNWSGRANEAIRPWRLVLTVVRWTLWCLLWFKWTWIGEQVFRGSSGKAEAQRQQWGRMRNSMMGGIAVVEALILFSHVAGG